ncbi:MAG: stress response translation initiation inhibitor YciH [Candidatus Omnitrophota bacterium]|jgi:translation initiation factor 1
MENNRDTNSRIVYSTSHGQMCPECSRPIKECACRGLKKAAVPKTDGFARVRYETKCRKGKGVIVIVGLTVNQLRLETLAKDLKHKFGTGGTVKDLAIELQGDHREQVTRELLKKGYLVK